MAAPTRTARPSTRTTLRSKNNAADRGPAQLPHHRAVGAASTNRCTEPVAQHAHRKEDQQDGLINKAAMRIQKPARGMDAAARG